MNNAKRAILYCRVSTDDQADKGYSLATQLEACRKYAERVGFNATGYQYYDVHTALEVIQKQGIWGFVDSVKAAKLAEEGPLKPIDPVAAFVEDCSGAISFATRPQGKKAAAMLRTGEANAIIVHVVDRLSRDIVDLLATVRIWLRGGAEVHTCDIGRVDSEFDIVLVIKGWQGSNEHKDIRRRSMDGKRTKARAGKVIGGRHPYGYRHVRDDDNKIKGFGIYEPEARIVRLIYKWYVDGDETGKRLSAGAIARRLSERREPTPGETKPGEKDRGYHRKRGAGMWGACKILQIVSHELYAGVWHFARRIGSSRKTRPADEQIPVSVPAIIDRETWERAQAQRLQNKAMSVRNAKHPYLLRGLMRCGCKSVLTGEFFSNHRYYSCSWRNNHHSHLEPRICRARSIRADAIEADIWEGVKEFFSNLPRLKMLLLIAQAEEEETVAPKREELESVEKLLADCDTDAADCGSAMRRAKGRVLQSLEMQMEEINARYDALVKRRDHLREEIASRRLTDPTIQGILQYAQDVSEGMEIAGIDAKRRNLETLQVTATVSNGHYFAKCILGEWEGEISKPQAAGIVRASHSPKPGLRGCRSP